MNSENKRHTRLQKLDGSDFEIADGEPDIRGWDVKDASGKKLGEVDELIFDFQARKVRYLVLDLDKNDYKIPRKNVLVPIGLAELHEKEDDVILSGVEVGQLQSLPEYDEDRFDTEHEDSIRNVFGGLGNAALHGTDTDNDFYEHEHFNDANLYRKRPRSGTTAESPETPADSSDGMNRREDTDSRKEYVQGGMGMRLRNRNIDTPGSTRDNSGSPEKGVDPYEFPIL